MKSNTGYGKLCKDRMIGEILNDLKDHPNFFITNFMGSSVSDLESVRKSLRPTQGTFLVVKNSMMNVVLDQLKLEDVKPLIDGGVGISLSGDDIIATSKVLVNFSKTHEKFKIKGAVIDGKLVAVDKINHMASLPAKDVLLAQVVRGMKAPITGFVGVMGGIIRKFVYVVDAVKVSKEKAPQAQPTQ
ncbi:MAG: 50S ribosomal protein L10 [Candidatus Omnitrophota bacterium]|jgi:large subunit ribosomal protein L10|nr:50S ribosomal protein L10 [Candidatus Omnitrophota bacterium]